MITQFDYVLGLFRPRPKPRVTVSFAIDISEFVASALRIQKLTSYLRNG